jgi:glycosyltransferase involved in cell wall biosynthesis
MNPIFSIITKALEGDQESIKFIDHLITIEGRLLNVLISYSHTHSIKLEQYIYFLSKLNNFPKFLLSQLKEGGKDNKTRPDGISIVLRLKNDFEYVKASIFSVYKFVDEIICVLNNSTDGTDEIVKELSKYLIKIKVYDYIQEIESPGANYFNNVITNPSMSIAKFYNYAFSLAKYSHVVKWDGDMIATHECENAFKEARSNDLTFFNGYDIFQEDTTAGEPRIFKMKTNRFYVDVKNLEELFAENSSHYIYKNPIYIHMKLAKNNIYKKYLCHWK